MFKNEGSPWVGPVRHGFTHRLAFRCRRQSGLSLRKAKTYERDNFIEDGGWIIVPGLEEQITGAADVCADRLVALESLPEKAVVPEASTTDAMPTEG